MLHLRLNWKIICTSVILAILIFSDGLINVVRANHVAGSFNLFRAPVFLVASVVAIIILSTHQSRINKTQIKFISVGIINTLIVVVFSIGGDVLRGMYDAVCIMTFYLITSLAFSDRVWQSNLLSNAFSQLFFWNIGLLGFALLLGDYLDPVGRLSGVIPTSSVFGTICALIFLLNLKCGNVNVVRATVLFGIILFTGTRAALVQFCAAPILLLYSKNIAVWKKIVSAIAICVVSAGVSILLVNKLEEGLRIFSVADLESGSASTRLYWYFLGWGYIDESSFLGGGGAGFATVLAGGHLLHFDLLRLWVDYSILSVVPLVVAVIWASRHSSPKLWWLYILLAFIIPGFHNALQAPELLLLSGLVLAARKAE